MTPIGQRASRREVKRGKKQARPTSPLRPLLLPPRPPPPHHLYVPQLHRQQTRLTSHLGPVSTALTTFASTRLGDNLSSRAGVAAQAEITELLDSIYLGLSRNQKGLKFRKYYLARGFCHWQTSAQQRVVCIAPFEVNAMVVHRHDFEAVLFTVPSSQAGQESDKRKRLDITSDEFPEQRYVSSRKVYLVLKKIIGKGLLAKGVSEKRLNFSSSKRVLEVALQDAKGWVAEIVPCLAVKGQSSVFCCKPLSSPDACATSGADSVSHIITPSPSLNSLQSIGCDQSETYSETDVLQDTTSPPRVTPEVNSKLQITSQTFTRNTGVADSVNGDARPPYSEISWYPCSVQKENTLLENIFRTDNGVRMSAAQIVHQLCEADWRLSDVSIYHVLTAMLHDTDYQVDHSPRWQRDRLEQCTRCILAKLREAAHARCLPHFLVQGVDLWADFPAKRLALMSGALDRLTSNDVALVSLVCRAGGFTLPAGVHMYSNLLLPPRSNHHLKAVNNGPSFKLAAKKLE